MFKKAVFGIKYVYNDGIIENFNIYCCCGDCMNHFRLDNKIFSRRYKRFMYIVEISEDKSVIYLEDLKQ